jgi:hypothetical protein
VQLDRQLADEVVDVAAGDARGERLEYGIGRSAGSLDVEPAAFGHPSEEYFSSRSPCPSSAGTWSGSG